MLKRVAFHSPAAARGVKPRLAIVSTFDDLCGIAGYTRFLIKQLEPSFDIEVFDLDQFFMRSVDPNVRRIADGMIRTFCARAGSFDFVNIQLEHGTLGARRKDIWRRLTMLAQAAPALSITFHTILPQGKLDVGGLAKSLATFKFGEVKDILGNYRSNALLVGKFYGFLRRLQKTKPVNIIVHTRRDMRLMRYVNRLDNVFDHPLAFLKADDARRLRIEAIDNRAPQLRSIPAGSKLIGVFGFLSEYKGFETVVQAMQRLPEEYHLVFFGGLHPNEIKKNVAIHPYVKQLLDNANAGRTALDDFGERSVTVAVDSNRLGDLMEHPKDIARRLHFLGPQTDEDFARGMAVCDLVVLPYLEVGQSASGPVSLALEMGARIIVARNLAFLQFARYHPNSLEFFDIGNFVELADRILSDPAYPDAQRPREYDAVSNAEVYIEANTRRSAKQKGIAQVAPAKVA
jgi:glycosyltransferase involved in cell wall biosynthesis